jgi:hypothetical protein
MWRMKIDDSNKIPYHQTQREKTDTYHIPNPSNFASAESQMNARFAMHPLCYAVPSNSMPCNVFQKAYRSRIIRRQSLLLITTRHSPTPPPPSQPMFVEFNLQETSSSKSNAPRPRVFCGSSPSSSPGLLWMWMCCRSLF